MRIIPIAMSAAAAIALLAPVASAQVYYRHAPVYVEPGYAAPAYYSPRAEGFYCVKECTQDTSPCDPPEFADVDWRMRAAQPRAYFRVRPSAAWKSKSLPTSGSASHCVMRGAINCARWWRA